MAIQVLIEAKLTSVKLVATRCMIKYSRKLKSEALSVHQDKFCLILEQLNTLLDASSLDSLNIPIEAMVQYSRISEDLVAQMAPKVTPKLLKLFRAYHNEGPLV